VTGRGAAFSSDVVAFEHAPREVSHQLYRHPRHSPGADQLRTAVL